MTDIGIFDVFNLENSQTSNDRCAQSSAPSLTRTTYHWIQDWYRLNGVMNPLIICLRRVPIPNPEFINEYQGQEKG